MRTTIRLAAPLAALALLAGACGADDGGDDVTDNGAEDTAATDDADEADDADDADEDGGDEHAEAIWDGEELVFSGVSCGAMPTTDGYEIRGRIDGGHSNLQARFVSDPDASDGDDIVLADDEPLNLTLFFDEGDTIGDGREFRADSDDLGTLDASVDHIAGTIHLEPNDDTQAPETHPDGGELEFELRCG